MRALLLALALLLQPVLLADDRRIKKDFDVTIQEASTVWLPWHWHWLKAQLYQESLLNPNAVSHAGAAGIAQFMPETCKEIFTLAGFECDPFDAEKSIYASAFYMSRLRSVFRANRPEWDRRRWAQAAYNRGIGNILSDQRKCGNRIYWHETEPCVSKKETIDYVKRIESIYFSLAKESIGIDKWKGWFDFCFNDIDIHCNDNYSIKNCKRKAGKHEIGNSNMRH